VSPIDVFWYAVAAIGGLIAGPFVVALAFALIVGLVLALLFLVVFLYEKFVE